MVRSSPRAVQVSGHGDVCLNVWDYGGEGQPLMLCHCTGTHGRVWDPVVEELQQCFHVYSLDSRGHGNSDKPPNREAYEWVKSGWDLLAVLDALGVGESPAIAGHSGGAAHIAYAEMLRPGAFDRVVLLDAIIGPEALFSGEAPLAGAARRRKRVFSSLEEARARLEEKPPMNAWRPEALDAYLKHGLARNENGAFELKCPPEIEAWMYELGGACDVFEKMDTLRFEALLVTGTESYIRPLVKMQCERLPRAAIHAMDGAGHFIPQEHPHRTAQRILDWFK